MDKGRLLVNIPCKGTPFSSMSYVLYLMENIRLSKKYNKYYRYIIGRLPIIKPTKPQGE